MDEPDRLPDIDEYFQTLRSIYSSLLIGCGMFAAVASFLARSRLEEPLVDGAAAVILMIGSLLIAAGVPYWGHRIFRRNIVPLTDEKLLEKKLDAYNKASIIRWACMEGALLFCLAAAIIIPHTTYSLIVLFAAAGVFVAFVRTSPKRERFAETFNLSREEEQAIFYGRSFTS